MNGSRPATTAARTDKLCGTCQASVVERDDHTWPSRCASCAADAARLEARKRHARAERKRQVLSWRAQGRTLREIAEDLGVSVHRVKQIATDRSV